jgi:hypothetical protein
MIEVIEVIVLGASPLLLLIWWLVYAYQHPDDVDPEMVPVVAGCLMMFGAGVVLLLLPETGAQK